MNDFMIPEKEKHVKFPTVNGGNTYKSITHYNSRQMIKILIFMKMFETNLKYFVVYFR